jgi:hypothetical protein
VIEKGEILKFHPFLYLKSRLPIGRIGFRFRRYFYVILRLIPLQPQNSPFGFRQLRLLALHFAKNENEKSLMSLKPILPIAALENPIKYFE